jgi:N-acetylglucosamine-6-sulfatase
VVKRVTFAVLAMLLVGGLVAAFLSFSARTQEEDQPRNIVYIVTDDMDRDLMMQLPNVKSLLRDEGTTLTNFNIPESICCPSRATTLLGEYPHNTGVIGNDESEEGGGVTAYNDNGGPTRSIGVNLQGQGYKTGFFGKYLNGFDATEKPAGWDRWFAKHRQRYYGYDVSDEDTTVKYGKRPDDYGDRVVGGQAYDWIEESLQTGAPFFAYVSPTAPHAPYDDPPGHETETPPDPDLYSSKPSFGEEDRSDKPGWVSDAAALTAEEETDIADRYTHRYRMALETDDLVADVYASLEAAGQLENTYIVFTSDNGWFNGEHAIPEKKLAAYEEATNVGAVVRGPGIPAGVERNELTSNHDLFATFSDVATTETSRDGRSLLPLLEGRMDSGEVPWRERLLLEHPKESGSRPLYYGVKTSTHKYVEYSTGEKELYDLEADPYELDNVYESADASVVADLQSRLEDLKTCAGESCRAAEDAT